MKKSINRLSIITAIIFLLQGCTKSFLDQTPSNQILINQALTTVPLMQTALNGAYALLRSVSLYGRDLPICGDLQADNTYVEAENTGRYLDQYQYTVISTDGISQEIWQTAYTGILAANQIINDTLTADGSAPIKAQAYAIRALLYFKLVNIYARPYTDDPTALGVPIVLQYNPFALPARNTVGEVYNQIISDFKAALPDAPAYSSSVTLSQYAIEALLARAYLYEGDNADAKAAAVDVINNSGFKLVSRNNLVAFWKNPANQTNQVEVMFEIDADGVNNNGFDDLGGMYINGYDDIYCSYQLYDLYNSTDVRSKLLLSGYTKGGYPAIVVNKFPNAENPSDRDNLKVIRLAEVYLIAAEASLPGNESDAKLYLNDLMAQRDPSLVYSSTGAQLLSDIVQERRKELAFEGDRLYDLNRLKLPVDRADNGPGALPAGLNNINLYIPYSDYRRISPIPDVEIQANPNIAKQQNPGY